MRDGRYYIKSMHTGDEEKDKKEKQVGRKNLNNLFLINKNVHASV